MQVIRLATPEQLTEFAPAATITLVNPEELARHAPDDHLLVDDGGTVRSRCSLWWRDLPEHGDRRLGYIGHYAADDDEAAALLLEHACRLLAGHGCRLAVGPLDGTTWRRYRFIVDRGDHPPFFLEPDNPDAWPRQFTAAGFTEFAAYLSALNTDLRHRDPRVAETAKRMADAGVSIRPLDLDRFAEELEKIFGLSLESFRNNLLYSPINRGEFMAMYTAVRPHVHPELTLVAEQEDAAVGFLFAVPDLLQAERGQAIDQVILKTIAVRPARALAGLGGLLLAKVLDNAVRTGYTKAIHALMHENNRSVNLGRGSTRPIRRYVLFAKDLP